MTYVVKKRNDWMKRDYHKNTINPRNDITMTFHIMIFSETLNCFNFKPL